MSEREMITPREAVELMIARARPVLTERVALGLAAGRVLAEPLTTDRDSPVCDVSAMDGFAVRLADVGMGAVPIAGDVMIGREPPALPPGMAVRIVTGGAVPPGTDTVVKREDVEEAEGVVTVRGEARGSLRQGAHIRRRGENLRQGAEVVGAGTEITPGVVGALATVGRAEPLVYRRVRVGVLSTGDEVVGVGDSPTRWQLRDSNGPALAALLGGRAWVEIAEVRHAADRREQLLGAVKSLLEACDAVFLTGGVSMGVRDFVPGVLREAGASVLFHKVNQRPGKPLLGAVGPGGQMIVALPGNPVSALVCARRIGLAALGAAAGMGPRAAERVQLSEPDEKTLGMWWHRLVRRDGRGGLVLVEHSSSGDVPGAARSDGFVEVPPGESGAGPWSFYPWM